MLAMGQQSYVGYGTTTVCWLVCNNGGPLAPGYCILPRVNRRRGGNAALAHAYNTLVVPGIAMG
jgi:hypothetical protein